MHFCIPSLQESRTKLFKSEQIPRCSEVNIYKSQIYPNFMKSKKQTPTKKAKALVLFSGGLDSRIALKLMQEQLGKENVLAINFILPFGGACCSKEFCIYNFVGKEEAKLISIDCTKGKLFEEYMEIIKHPKHGRGTSLNPCIDCHLFMLKKAKEYANKEKIDILVTGEVLGERPLSQTRRAFSILDKNKEFEVLRPLSAKLLEETSWEKEKLIDRDKLLDIQGRRRDKQMELAKKFKISYPTPGGGCLLCEKGYCAKLKPILNDTLSYNDIKLLSIGRHFDNSKIIIGRNQEENIILEKEKGIKVLPEDNPGGTALIKSGDKSLIEKAKILIQQHSKHKINEFEILE